MARYFLQLLIVLLCSGGAGAQVYQLQGRITDAGTGEGIPFVSIGVRNQPYGTSSNERGDFLFRIPVLPAEIVFSHISYKRKIIRVEEELQQMMIVMEPGEILMPELVVTEKPVNEMAYLLVERARQRLETFQNRRRYGKAFYRQISNNDGDYCELYEIFYDTRYSRNGINEWAIQEGRYALKTAGKASAYIFNKNFTQLFRILSTLQPPTNDLLQPINPEVRSYYDLRINRWIDLEDNKIAVIGFTPRDDVNIPAMEGELYIDGSNYDLLKMEGEIRNDKLRFISLSEKEGSWKDYVLYFDIAFQRNSMNELQLDYVSMRHEFEYYVSGARRHSVQTRALLSYYDQEQPERRRRLGGKIQRYNRRDADVLEELGYNREFWEDNPIVKRTPVEEEVIASFEATSSFGSIYLNNRDQLVLEDKALDSEPFVSMLLANLRETRLAPTTEKVYLHLDKPYCASGESLWYKAYLVNAATHLLTSRSGTLYVELLSDNGTILSESMNELIDGLGAGSIDIPENLATGQYQLRAYTRWMRNFDEEYFYQAALPVYNSLNPQPPKSEKTRSPGIDLQFFPEGGYTIAGIPSQVAFKALGPDGRSREVSGGIYNQSGSRVASFQSTHRGMGAFIFGGVAGDKYTARIDGSGQVVAFPEALASGFSIMVNNYRPNSVDILIKTSEDLKDTDFYIVGQTRGIVYHRFKGRVINRAARVEIPKAKLPDGIFHITLFDQDQKPQCERLVYIDKGYYPSFSLRGIDSPPAARDRIVLELQVRDYAGNPLRNANLSVAALDARQIKWEPNAGNIQNYLLLSSDLRGYIEEPGFYLGDPDNLEKMKALDLVMLTHGWRRFTWQEVIENPKRQYAFTFEDGFTVRGKATLSGTSQPASNLYLTMLSTGGMIGYVLKTQTGPDGTFSMPNSRVMRNVPFVVRAEDMQGREFPVNLSLTLEERSPVDFRLPLLTPVYDDVVDRYLKSDKEGRLVEGSFAQQSDVILPEIQVAAQRDRPAPNTFGEPDAVIRVTERDFVFTDVFQMLQGRVPGLNIAGQGANAQVNIRGRTSLLGDNTPLFMIDGIVLSSATPAAQMPSFTQPTSAPPSGAPGAQGGGGTTSTASTESSASLIGGGTDNALMSVLSIPPTEIERIEVYKNASASAAFGMRGANGVIAIYTRRGPSVDLSVTPSMARVEMPGYSAMREYYQPNYFTISAEQRGQDSRSSLLWDPGLKTDDRGRVRVEFYNSDVAKDIEVIFEGLSDYGDPLYHRTLIGRERRAR